MAVAARLAPLSSLACHGESITLTIPQPLSMTVNVLGAVADVIIAAGLFFYLHRSRTGFKKSDTMISKLVSVCLSSQNFWGGLRKP